MLKDEFLSTNDMTQEWAACCSPSDFCSKKGTIMPKIGTVKFFNNDKGYGFIQPDDGTSDYFVHITSCKLQVLNTRKEQRLNFDVEKGRNGKESAVNLSAQTSNKI